MAHGRVDCATGRRLTTAKEAAAHASICAAYAAERAHNLAHPTPYIHGQYAPAKNDRRFAAALRDRIKDNS